MTPQRSTPSDKTSPYAKSILRFGEFHIDRSTFELRKAKQVIAMEPQVFSLLLYLVEHRDRVVAKDELLDELWGHRFVSESALTTQIKWLRKAVGDDGRSQSVVKTIHGRGYRFIAEIVEAHQQSGQSSVSPATRNFEHNLPRERTRLFGRERDVERVAVNVLEHRLVSLLGVGGIGKTRLGIAAARMSLEHFPDGVFLVDLVPATNESGVEYALSETLGLALHDGALLPQLVEFLCAKSLLLVFDNCEHVRDAAATLVDQLLESCPSIRILTTSRDPLDLPDECQMFIEPLAIAAAAGDAPAVQLFNAAAKRAGGRIPGDDVEMVRTACAMLDGLPLALELAAAQLKYLTLAELIKRLDRPLQVLTRHGRAKSHRQASLARVLQDSWVMLSDTEQSMLAQLAVFPSHFSIDDVEALYSGVEFSELNAVFARLVELSLLNRTASSGANWRLLETVRLFVLDKTSAEERQRYIRRHGQWCIRHLGKYPEDHLHNLEQASWCMSHSADLVAAEENFLKIGDVYDAMFVCASTGLMVQLDDGAGARARRIRAAAYLDEAKDHYWQARLHAISGLCAQANRATSDLINHSRLFSGAAEKAGDPLLLAEARLMTSLTEVFNAPEQALQSLDDVEALGRSANSPSTVASSRCYRAWQLAIHRDYDAAVEIALGIASQQYSRADNTAYNAVCIITSCSVVRSPQTAREWVMRLNDFPAVLDFWGIQALQACVAAISGQTGDAARSALAIRARLRQAGRDELPDLLVPVSLLAYSIGQLARARQWLRILRELRRPIQTYHMMIVYRQLYEKIGFAEQNPLDELTPDDVRQEAAHWMNSIAKAG